MLNTAATRIGTALCLISLWTASLLAAPLAPRLIVDEQDGTTRLSVQLGDGGPTTFLRETAARVEAGPAGGDPAGRAAFTTWFEDGQPYFSYSRDAGVSWSPARQRQDLLLLRDGAVAPEQALPVPPAPLAAGPGERVFLVQFETISLPEWRLALEAAGGEILAAFPHDAHIVRIDPSRLGNLAALDFVARIEPYHPWYRLAEPVRRWLEQQPEQPRRFWVMAFEWGEAGKARIARAARALGARIVEHWPSGHIIDLELTASQLRRLAHHDDVMWIDPWSAPEDDMNLVREDSGANYIESVGGYCGTGVNGEVLDSGTEETHQDFDGIMIHGSGNSSSSHGTKSYGVVFGNGDRDGDGDPNATGHLPCAQGIAADYDFLGDRFAHTQELKQAPYFASFQTNSWGAARTRSYTSKSHEMDDIIWRLDILILQSQSNAGNQDSRPQAWAKNIVSVGGIYHENTLTVSDDNWSGGASIGPAEDGRIKPDISYWYDSIYTTTTGNGYGQHSGTSAATPESAGVFGLLVEMWADNVWGTDPVGSTPFEKQPHFSTLKALAINTAEQYTFSGEGHDLTRMHQGWGRINARNAYDRAATSLIVDQGVPLQLGDISSYDVQVADGESELKITMVYPDPPGTTSASLHRINDVDLKVSSPSGTVYYGNVGLEASNESSPGGARNGIDTVENVFVQNPEAGVWTVEVEAREINQDGYLDTPESDVVFSLVVTGGSGDVCAAPTADFTITPNPARVGQSVLFDSTVSGGAGGPYEYRWDFDADGATDSTAEDPTHVYHRPWTGIVQLRVSDAANCPQKVEHNMDVTGPDLRYADFSIAEVEGNGNGKVDPGETWDLTASLRNQGNETAVGSQADLAVNAATPASVVIEQGTSSYGDIAVDLSASGTPAYRFRVGSDFPCGQDIVFDLVNIRSLDPDNVYPDEIGVIRILVGGSGPPQVVYEDTFESNPGWSFNGNGEWEIAPPQGLGGGTTLPGGGTSNSDPATAFEGSAVMGNDLSGLGRWEGNYEANVVSTATSPPIDLSGAADTTLEFWRWLNVALGDTARLEISADGSNWTTLTEESGVQEGEWVFSSYDVSAVADGAAAFRVRFGLETDGGLFFSGWNIDSLVIEGVTRDSCEPFTPPVVPGASAGLQVSRTGGGDLRLNWNADCGGTSSYGIYRGDLAIGYGSLAAEPGFCDVAGTTADIPEGAGAADFLLVVPNDGVFEGSYGADSAGTSRDPASTACYPTDQVDGCAP